MDKSELQKQIQTIHRQGYLTKQSRILKTWRQRWVVLTNNLLMTFKERRVYENPTEVINLKDILVMKGSEEHQQPNVFKVETSENSFYFSAQTATQKEQWLGSVGKIMVKNTRKFEDD